MPNNFIHRRAGDVMAVSRHGASRTPISLRYIPRPTNASTSGCDRIAAGKEQQSKPLEVYGLRDQERTEVGALRLTEEFEP